jgi:hypothetical protein
MEIDPRSRTGITIQAGPVPFGLWPAVERELVAAAAELGIRLRAMLVDAPDLGIPMIDLDEVELSRLRARVAELEAALGEQATALAFETTCTSCGQAWGVAYDERLRRDAADAQLVRVQQAFDWLAGILATSARDWSTSHDLALIYGVILGWHNPDDPDDDGGALREIAELFTDGPGFIDRMQEHRATVRALDAASAPAGGDAGSPPNL